MYFNVGTDQYWYEQHGASGPWIVLLHGFTGRTTTWDTLLPKLTNTFRVLTVDLPGHGYTQTGRKTMHTCAQDLDTLFDYLQLDHFHLLGYSLGGRTVLFYTITHPDRVQSLVLESASPGLETQTQRDDRTARDERLALKLETEGLESFVDFWENVPLFYTQKQLVASVQSAIRRERLSQTPEGLANSLRGMGTGAQPSLWGALGHVNCPVLLLSGELDDKFVEINRAMKDRLPNAQLEMIPRAGHALHVEVPEMFGKIVSNFMIHQTTKLY